MPILPEPSMVEEILENPRYMSWGKQLVGVLAVLFLMFGVLRPVLRNLATVNKTDPAALPPGESAAGAPLKACHPVRWRKTRSA